MTDHPFEPIERGSTFGPVAPAGPVVPPSTTEQEQALGLVYEHGLEVQVRSQWSYVRRRFMRHRLAMSGLIVLVVVLLAGALASLVAPYGYAGLHVEALLQGPSLSHPFGTDLL